MRDINSIVLVTNGISFAIQVVLFLFLGSYADYGTWRRWILIVFTVASIAISFAWLGCEDPDKWLSVGTTLYIVGLIGYQGRFFDSISNVWNLFSSTGFKCRNLFGLLSDICLPLQVHSLFGQQHFLYWLDRYLK